MTSIYAWPEDEGNALSQQFAAELRNRGIEPSASKRRAGELPMQLVDQAKDAAVNAGVDLATRFKGFNTWGPKKIALGGGGLALGGLLAALGELNNSDPTVTNPQKVGGALGAGLGSVGLGAGGAALAGFLGGGPVGALVLGSLAAAAGAAGGGAAGRAAVSAFGPTELDRQITAYQRTAQAQADAKAYEMQTLLPIQKQVADAVLANQIKGAAAMAPIEAQKMRNQALYQGLINGQQQQAQLANTALSGLYSGGFI